MDGPQAKIPFPREDCDQKYTCAAIWLQDALRTTVDYPRSDTELERLSLARNACSIYSMWLLSIK